MGRAMRDKRERPGKVSRRKTRQKSAGAHPPPPAQRAEGPAISSAPDAAGPADAIDRRLLTAAGELTERQLAQIRRALKKPTPWGAFIDAHTAPGGEARDPARHVRTCAGFVVVNGFVTPLGAELIEVLDWHQPALGAAR